MAATQYQRRKTRKAEQQALKAQEQAAEAARNTFTARLATAASGLAAATTNTADRLAAGVHSTVSNLGQVGANAADYTRDTLNSTASYIATAASSTADLFAANVHSTASSLGQAGTNAADYTRGILHSAVDVAASLPGDALTMLLPYGAATSKEDRRYNENAIISARLATYSAGEKRAFLSSLFSMYQQLPPTLAAGNYQVTLLSGQTIRFILPAGVDVATLVEHYRKYSQALPVFGPARPAIAAPSSSPVIEEISSDTDSDNEDEFHDAVAGPAANTAPPFNAGHIFNASKADYNDAKKTVKPGFWSNALTSVKSLFNSIKQWLIETFPRAANFMGLTSALPKSVESEPSIGTGSAGKMGALGDSVAAALPEARPAQSLAAVNESEPAAGADLGADADASTGFALR